MVFTSDTKKLCIFHHGACLVEVLNLVDDQHSERVQIGYLAHGCQQTFGTSFLRPWLRLLVGTQDLVYFVEEAQAQLIQVTVNWAVDLQIDQLSDVVIRVMEGLGVHARIRSSVRVLPQPEQPNSDRLLAVEETLWYTAASRSSSSTRR